MTDANITDPRPDFLSPVATAILDSHPDAYRKLRVAGRTPDDAVAALKYVTPDQLLTVPIQNRDEAMAMLAGLWLWLDGLKEAHEMAQDLVGPTGAFWHAIVHRREGDFSNAKYWYARCADHRALRLVSAMARDIVGRDTQDKSILRIVAGEYNPDAMVDLVEAIADKPQDPRYEAAVRLQKLEWEALFSHCAYEATGSQGGMI